jgi:Leucine-rich repeat (LRR) protein
MGATCSNRRSAQIHPLGGKAPKPATKSALTTALRRAKTYLDLSQEEGTEGLVCPILTTLPIEICDLRGLEVLNLRRNQLAELPSEIRFLSKLRELDVSENRLTLLPETLGECSKLEQIFASENAIVGIPTTLGRLVALWRLILFKNQLVLLPDELGDCTRLREVRDTRHLCIKAIGRGRPGGRVAWPSVPECLPSLRVLSCRHTCSSTCSTTASCASPRLSAR